jgi:hypothetical protein
VVVWRSHNAIEEFVSTKISRGWGLCKVLSSVFEIDRITKLIDGKAEIGSWKGFDGMTWYMHQDKESARDSIHRFRELGQMEGGGVSSCFGSCLS